MFQERKEKVGRRQLRGLHFQTPAKADTQKFLQQIREDQTLLLSILHSTLVGSEFTL